MSVRLAFLGPLTPASIEGFSKGADIHTDDLRTCHGKIYVRLLCVFLWCSFHWTAFFSLECCLLLGILPYRLFLAITAGLAALFPAVFGLGLSWNHLPSRVLPCHFLLRHLPCLRLTGLVGAVHLASLSIGGTSHSESNGRH